MYKPCKINVSVKPVKQGFSQSPIRSVSFRQNQAFSSQLRPLTLRSFATVGSEQKTIDPYAKASNVKLSFHINLSEKHIARPGSKEALQESDFAAEADARNFANEPDSDRPENADPKSTYTDGHPNDLGLKHPFKEVLNSAENPQPAKPTTTAETAKAKQKSSQEPATKSA